MIVKDAYRSADLTVDAHRLADWNRPERRRESFRKLHLLHRRGMTFRATTILPLLSGPKPPLSDFPSLNQLIQLPAFCGLAVAQGQRIIVEEYAPDFGRNEPHSMQSITKTFVHLALGRLVEASLVNPALPIGHYLPEIGHGYADATVQQALDMDVSNNFSEDYAAPYKASAVPGEPVGYAREEIAMGWRLPPDGEADFGVRTFAAGLDKTTPNTPSGTTLYKSPNTDVLAWIVETVSKQPLTEFIADIVDAAGIENAFHISLDCNSVPVLSGGGVMTTRDLLRYGLLFARRGEGVNGRRVASLSFLEDAMRGSGTRYDGPNGCQRYRNHLLTTRTWIGHPGYAGQFLMVSPAKCAAAAFYSVLETPYGDKPGYFTEVVSVLEHILDSL